jgi:hypothetical protein
MQDVRFYTTEMLWAHWHPRDAPSKKKRSGLAHKTKGQKNKRMMLPSNFTPLGVYLFTTRARGARSERSP